MEGFLTEGQIAQLILLIGAVSAAAVAIIRELRANRNAQIAASVVQATQQNRYLETRGAAPVTMSSPPTSTGTGGVDAAVTAILTDAAPAGATAVPPSLEARMARIEEMLERLGGPDAAR